jgi:hypothetical protein
MYTDFLHLSADPVTGVGASKTPNVVQFAWNKLIAI